MLPFMSLYLCLRLKSKMTPTNVFRPRNACAFISSVRLYPPIPRTLFYAPDRRVMRQAVRAADDR